VSLLESGVPPIRCADLAWTLSALPPGNGRSSISLETGMLGWFQAIMPKEERFFDMFLRHAHVLVAGSEALNGLLKGGDSVPRYCQIIVERENEADEITREVMMAVRRTFITPFDRGDIKDLINSMDDAIDQMNKAAKSITLFEVRSFSPSMVEIGELVSQCATLTVEGVTLLRSIGKNAARIGTITEEIIRIEERADQLHNQGLKELFQAHRNANTMDFIIGNEVYDHLEKIVDRFEDVGNEISAIVIEHL
jgi:predicted phosphate transport protein (TIGR00153 family)